MLYCTVLCCTVLQRREEPNRDGSDGHTQDTQDSHTLVETRVITRGTEDIVWSIAGEPYRAAFLHGLIDSAHTHTHRQNEIHQDRTILLLHSSFIPSERCHLLARPSIPFLAQRRRPFAFPQPRTAHPFLLLHARHRIHCRRRCGHRPRLRLRLRLRSTRTTAHSAAR